MSAALTKIDYFKKSLIDSYGKSISTYFGKNEERQRKFLATAVQCVTKTPKLLDCTPQSLFQSIMDCAEYGLFPGTIGGEAYIIPYGNVAQFQLGYQGIVKLMNRAGIKKVYSDVIYSNDSFTYESGLYPKLEHKPTFGDRGEAIGVYAWAELDGERIFKVMSKSDVMKFKAKSKSAGAGKSSPWDPSSDPELWMWRKTAIKQLGKLIPKTDAWQDALAKDTEQDITETPIDVPSTADMQKLLSDAQPAPAGDMPAVETAPAKPQPKPKAKPAVEAVAAEPMISPEQIMRIKSLLPPSTDMAPPQQIELAIAQYAGVEKELKDLTATDAGYVIMGLEAEQAERMKAEMTAESAATESDPVDDAGRIFDEA